MASFARSSVHLGAAYKHAAYAVQMGTRPQTMYGLDDSPVFLAAYMIDHDPTSYATLIAPAFVDGDEGGLTRDDILDNITMFWLTNTGVDRGGHFAAWEQPELYASELRQGFRSLR